MRIDYKFAQFVAWLSVDQPAERIHEAYSLDIHVLSPRSRQYDLANKVID